MDLNKGKYTNRPGTLTVDTGATGVMDAVGDTMVFDVRDLINISVLLNQLVDGGTATLKIDYSVDGTNWVPAVATKADTDFAAANNVAIQAYTLSDANGMPLVAEQIKVYLSAYTAGGSYSASVVGLQRAGWTG